MDSQSFVMKPGLTRFLTLTEKHRVTIPGVGSCELEITPALASLILEEMEPNRSMRKKRVETYARDHARNEFHLNGESIIFNDDGKLIDGQHRLEMIVKANKAAVVHVVWGIDPHAAHTIDSGAARTTGDVFRMEEDRLTEDVAFSNVVASATVYMLAHKAGGGRVTPSKSEQREIRRKHPLLVDSVRLTLKCKSVPQGMLAAVHYMARWMTGVNGEVYADAFVKTMVDGVGPGGVCVHGEDDPALVWYRTAMAYKASPTKRLVRDVIFASTIHAWNLYAVGEKRKTWKPVKPPVLIKGVNNNLI